MRILASVILLVLLTSCENKIQTDTTLPQSNWFDLQAFIAQKIEKLQGEQIQKTVISTTTESRIFEDVDWNLEFQPFSQVNINKPALWDKYRVDTALISGNYKINYAAIDSSLYTKKLSVLYLDRALPLDTVYSIEILNKFSSVIADSRQQLLLEQNSYEISTQQEVIWSEPRALRIKAKWNF